MNDWNQERIEQAWTCAITRRQFINGMMATGALTAMPDGLLKAATPDSKPTRNEIGYNEPYQVYRNACPRNCYDTCSINTYVKNGVIEFIEGAPESTFTDGSLCVKGYSYWRRVYSPDRIKYPMVQQGRGSGKWRRISWDEALDRIAKKILEIKEKDGSLLGMMLDKGSGNVSVSNYADNGMMTSLGYTTRVAGSSCMSAGTDAQYYDMGGLACNDPEDLPESRYIILWGGNPAWCSVHSMKYIFAARDRGARILAIDPIYTQTAAKADEYWQVNTGQDGALALGMARHILDRGLVDREFVENQALGFNDFAAYLKQEITLTWAAGKSGIPVDVIKQAAEAFATAKPATIWLGLGLQRHTN
ncbi:MAG: molybdopterin-dependent oxidoreductase, partial [Deltaproteobacteria bacterium]|nr:molybdopterin-dependent oxidoreductase [Deltaproteobacteria bacterium]